MLELVSGHIRFEGICHTMCAWLKRLKEFRKKSTPNKSTGVSRRSKQVYIRQ